MPSFETIQTIFFFLLGLGVGVAVIYLGLAVISFVVLLPVTIVIAVASFCWGLVVVSGVLLWMLAKKVWSSGLAKLGFGGQRTAGAEGFTQSGGAESVQVQSSVFDPYEVLEVPRGTNMAEIRKAYLHQMRQYHPDKVAHLGKELQVFAEERAKKIQHAFTLIQGV